MIRMISFILIMLVVASCGNNEPKTIESKQDSSAMIRSSQGPATPTAPADTTVSKKNSMQKGDKIEVTMGLNDSVQLRCHVDSSMRSLHCFVDVKNGKQLNINVEPSTGKGNIRINQITDPNNNSDGPFGKTLSYDLKTSGKYEVTIGSSLMADYPFTGDFMLSLEVK